MSNMPAVLEEESIHDLIDRVATQNDRVILIRDGKEVAALVPMEDLETLEELDDLMELEEVRAARKEAREKGTIPWEKLKADLGL